MHRMLLPSEAVALMRHLKPALRAEGQRRRQEAWMSREGKNNLGAGRHNTREILAARCGYGGRSLEKALCVVEAAERDPDRYGGAVRKMDDTGNIDAAWSTVVDPSTVRLKRQNDPIFSTVLLGRREMIGDLTARDLRWLITLFGELARWMGEPSSAHAYAGDLFTAAQVRRAVALANRARAKSAGGRGRLPPKDFAKSSPKAAAYARHR